MSDYKNMVLLKRIVDNSKIQDAPTKTVWGDGMVMISVAVGNDETACVVLHKDAVKYLQEMSE